MHSVSGAEDKCTQRRGKWGSTARVWDSWTVLSQGRTGGERSEQKREWLEPSSVPHNYWEKHTRMDFAIKVDQNTCPRSERENRKKSRHISHTTRCNKSTLPVSADLIHHALKNFKCYHIQTALILGGGGFVFCFFFSFPLFHLLFSWIMDCLIWMSPRGSWRGLFNQRNRGEFVEDQTNSHTF